MYTRQKGAHFWHNKIPLYWEKDIIKPEDTVKNGVINIPDKPGIGYEIDHDLLERFRINLQTFDFRGS